MPFFFFKYARCVPLDVGICMCPFACVSQCATGSMLGGRDRRTIAHDGERPSGYDSTSAQIRIARLTTNGWEGAECRPSSPLAADTWMATEPGQTEARPGPEPGQTGARRGPDVLPSPLLQGLTVYNSMTDPVGPVEKQNTRTTGPADRLRRETHRSPKQQPRSATGRRIALQRVVFQVAGLTALWSLWASVGLHAQHNRSRWRPKAGIIKPTRVTSLGNVQKKRFTKNR